MSRAMSALRARCQDARVYSSILNELLKREDDRVPFVGCGICGGRKFPPDIAKIRYFTPNPF